MQLVVFFITLILSLLPSDTTVTDTLLSMRTAQISIPAIHVDAEVVPVELKAFPGGIVTWDVSQIDWEVGYFEGTAWFGQGSNTVLGGHSELEARQPGVFQSLDQLDVGDVVTVTTPHDQWHFVVDQITTVAIDDLSLLYPTEEAQLTLITCDPQSYTESNGTVHYDRRIVVTAHVIPGSDASDAPDFSS